MSRAEGTLVAPVVPAGRLALLVLQPTPFCNIACDYCYLPDRGNRARMSMETLAAALASCREAGLLGDELSVVWHAGEPLVLPPSYYAQAFEVVGKNLPDSLAVHHGFQTNGILIDDEWCRFLGKHPVRLGVSLDGPEELHDRHRRTRGGRGTHAAVLRGISRLRDAGLGFHSICVLTRDSLGLADEIFDFFVSLGVREVGFNIEEIEGCHERSSLEVESIETEFRRFWERILERLRTAPGSLRIREVEDVLFALRHPAFGASTHNTQNEPLRIVSVSHDGGWSTYSPELLGLTSDRYGALSFGNVMQDRLADVLTSPRFVRVAAAVERGVEECRRTCRYFSFCRGGAPANKLAETGVLDSTETLFCRLTAQVTVDCVLRALEGDLRGELQGPGVNPTRWWQQRRP